MLWLTKKFYWVPSRLAYIPVMLGVPMTEGMAYYCAPGAF